MACLVIVRGSRVGRPRDLLRLFGAYGRYFLITNLAASCCGFSGSLIWTVVCGFHIGEAYLSFGQTCIL